MKLESLERSLIHSPGLCAAPMLTPAAVESQSRKQCKQRSQPAEAEPVPNAPKVPNVPNVPKVPWQGNETGQEKLLALSMGQRH